MGRRKRSQARVFANKSKNFNRGGERKNYELPPRENEMFVKYYKGLDIVPEGEWDEFFTTLQKTLPVTFRITGYKSEAQELLKNIKGTFFEELLNHQVDGVDIPPPKCLPWYPNELGWQLDLSRKIVRSSECLSRLHDFLVAETECGAISRQEAVSMIPPLCLDIQPQHTVLDMCAAPGSKTAQLIEYLHSGCKNGELPTGYVIANDADNRRCYMMVHQVKRLASPCCVIVNHDATIFPRIRTSEGSNPEYQLFDRVLCDVPCSGDGTMRKNFDVWAKWHPLQGANMHGLQCKILRRGCQLLAKGGRLVYSTCSLNPVEDEAVIADILRDSDGAMELVDIHDHLPGLKYRAGVSSWKVMSRTGEWMASQEDVPEAMKTTYRGTIFPPTPEEAEKFHLDKCIRILPHMQDTGGFFVAALVKVRHLTGSKEAKEEEWQKQQKEKEEKMEDDKSEDKSSPANGENPDTNSTENKYDSRVGQEPQAKKRRIFGCYKEDPFYFMETTDPVWSPLKTFFGLSEVFPADQIMFRSLQGKRTLYFVSKAMREVVKFNTEHVKFINMGVKAFSRSPSPLVPQCDFRITQECLHTIQSSIQHRRVSVSKQDAVTIISEENPFTHKLSPHAQTQLEHLDPGSTMFIYTASDEVPSPKCDIFFCGWRGKTSVRCFGSKVDRTHMLMLLGEDLKEINKRVQEEKRAKQNLRQDDDLPPLKEEGNGEGGQKEGVKEEGEDGVKEEGESGVKEGVKEEGVKEKGVKEEGVKEEGVKEAGGDVEVKAEEASTDDKPSDTVKNEEKMEEGS